MTRYQKTYSTEKVAKYMVKLGAPTWSYPLKERSFVELNERQFEDQIKFSSIIQR